MMVRCSVNCSRPFRSPFTDFNDGRSEYGRFCVAPGSRFLPSQNVLYQSRRTSQGSGYYGLKFEDLGECPKEDMGVLARRNGMRSVFGNDRRIKVEDIARANRDLFAVIRRCKQ